MRDESEGACRSSHSLARPPEAERPIFGAFGALIPVNAPVLVPQVIILPLVAFDLNGIRLGYGGGFYDRTLQALRAKGSLHTVGFAYAAQQSDALPSDATDQRLDAIVTERGVRVF